MTNAVIAQAGAATAPDAPVDDFFRVRHSGPLTALQLTDRIIGETGAPGRPQTVDRITAGDPSTAVTGIAVTAMATFDCLKAAAAANCNLVVTYEPVWWSEGDSLDRMEGNGLFIAKRDFVRAHNMVVFNFHDHWRDRAPDGITAGMAKTLGWEAYVTNASHPTIFTLPQTTLLDLAKEFCTKLSDRTMRMVGDPRLRVRTVAGSWGNVEQIPTIHLLNGSADVVICGYTHEWEAVEYAQDMISVGDKKGLILLGDVKSIACGMKYCADWIKSFISDVPVTFVPVVEPYWNPDDIRR
jgi:putative NIF3 family GTP cyclohydrolase 1 type 2